MNCSKGKYLRNQIKKKNKLTLGLTNQTTEKTHKF